MPWSLGAARRYLLAYLRRGGRMPVYAPGGVIPAPDPQAMRAASAAYGMWQIVGADWSDWSAPLFLLSGESVVPLGGAGEDADGTCGVSWEERAGLQGPVPAVPLYVAENAEPVGYVTVSDEPADWARANPALGVEVDVAVAEEAIAAMRAAIIGDMHAAIIGDEDDARRPGDPPGGPCLVHGRWDCRTCWSTR
jgi:hypothetical protein